MKINKLFPFALAAMALASCSNDDENVTNPNGGNAEVVDAITVSFKNGGTYATGDEVAGVETENLVYHAFVFAREAAPEFMPNTPGDYTVKEVGTFGSITAIVEGDGKTEGTLKNMVSFKGVAVGDDVFVIANDPKLTLEDAQKLSRKGTGSAAAIKAYKMALDKSYLGSLTVKKGANPSKQFVMAGFGVVPKGANGTTVTLEIGLDREMAKVDFIAQVTPVATAPAFGKIELKAEDGAADTWTGKDGVVVVRIPRSAAPFGTLAANDYFPVKAAVGDFDWSVDQTNLDLWPAFAGESLNKYGEVEIDKPFNLTPYAVGVKEYRYTWTIGDPLMTANTGKLTSPTFYVTPNYSAMDYSRTVVVTQATYMGETTIDPAITSEMLTALGTPKGETAWVTTADGNLDKVFKAIQAYSQDDEAIKALKTKYAASTKCDDLIDYKQYQKVYYAADVALYTGDKSDKITKRNTFYQMTGTITTLGAKSIKDAIAGSNVDMLVKVVVKPWTIVLNDQISM